MSEVEVFVQPYEQMMKGEAATAFVLTFPMTNRYVRASDYDALAADLASAIADKEAYGQNAINLRGRLDEGLARELSLNHDLLDAKEHIHLLTKRIAEAQKVIGRAFDTLEHVRRGANITSQDAWDACEILESFNRDAFKILESFNSDVKKEKIK